MELEQLAVTEGGGRLHRKGGRGRRKGKGKGEGEFLPIQYNGKHSDILLVAVELLRTDPCQPSILKQEAKREK